jgi:hypothetical protein
MGRENAGGLPFQGEVVLLANIAAAGGVLFVVKASGDEATTLETARCNIIVFTAAQSASSSKSHESTYAYIARLRSA